MFSVNVIRINAACDKTDRPCKPYNIQCQENSCTKQSYAHLCEELHKSTDYRFSRTAYTSLDLLINAHCTVENAGNRCNQQITVGNICDLCPWIFQEDSYHRFTTENQKTAEQNPQNEIELPGSANAVLDAVPPSPYVTLGAIAQNYLVAIVRYN